MATHREYTKEVGIASHKKTMPRPLAYAILAIVAVGLSFGVANVLKRAKTHHAAEKPAASSAAASP